MYHLVGIYHLLWELLIRLWNVTLKKPWGIVAEREVHFSKLTNDLYGWVYIIRQYTFPNTHTHLFSYVNEGAWG